MRRSTIVPALALLLAAPLSAHENHSHEHGHAHVHGAAHLTIALEQGVMILDFRAPADSIVGFEQAAQTPEQKAALDAAISKLGQDHSIIDLASSDCRRTGTEITTTGALSSSTEPGATDGHADFVAVLLLECPGNRLPDNLQITAFASFPVLETLDVQWVINGKQGAQTLTGATPLLRW